MAVFDTANGSSPGRSGQSFDSIRFGVTKENQLEVLSKKNFEKCSLEIKNQLLKIEKTLHHGAAIVAVIPCQIAIIIKRI